LCPLFVESESEYPEIDSTVCNTVKKERIHYIKKAIAIHCRGYNLNSENWLKVQSMMPCPHEESEETNYDEGLTYFHFLAFPAHV
jgi:hypothetical protein